MGREKPAESWSDRPGRSNVVAPMRVARWLTGASRCSWTSQGNKSLVIGLSCMCCKVLTRPATKAYRVTSLLLVDWGVCLHTQLRMKNFMVVWKMIVLSVSS